jgi:nitronate monooxygenase
MDPDNLPQADASSINFGQDREKPKAWKTIWGSGQGIGAIKSVGPAGDIVDRMEAEYLAAGKKLAAEFS